MRILTIAAFAVAAAPALAEFERREAQGSVEEAFARLENAVESAGAQVFATVDHGRGAADIGKELAPARLLIFGNPEIGTQVMQHDPLAGLVLPLRMLVYAENGQTYVAYEEVEEMVDDLELDGEMEALQQMERALEDFATAAAGG